MNLSAGRSTTSNWPLGRKNNGQSRMSRANPIRSLGRPDGRALMAKVSQHHALRVPYGSHHGSGGKRNVQEVNPGKRLTMWTIPRSLMSLFFTA